jgi:cis-L-3-hydroxyproline dehydratase
MFLTDDEKRMLDGAEGRVKQVSMEFIVNYAKALNAERLCRVTKAQVFCGNHLYLKAINQPDIDKAIAMMHFATEEPLQFDSDTACYSQTCALRTDLEKWAELGFTQEEADENAAYLKRYKKAGIHMVGTCAPYMTGFLPIMGEHYVCTESHAIIFMNSIWGACANADGIAAAFCSAMCGRTAYWGNHVPAQRKANMLVNIECATETVHDWDSLGFVLGRQSPAFSIPALKLENTETADAERLRSAFASMATSGGIELCHVIGVTPEARDMAAVFGGTKPEMGINITAKDIRDARAFLCETGGGHVDYIHLGCPHYSLEQIAAVARFLDGKTIKDSIELHVWTAPAIRYLAEINGYAKSIENAGGKLLAGSCALVTGKLPKGVKSIAFDSAKQANPQKSQFKGKVFYGSQENCLRAALSGKWEALNG